MANYSTLISAIQSVINENGNNEITGPILQQSLVAIINALGAGYQYIGVATPETTPGTPDQRVFYLAGPGVYPNFGPTTIDGNRIGVFKYASSWTVELLEFPIADGSVTYEKLATSVQQILETLTLENTDDGDFCIGDERNYDIVRFIRGHIKTKNFDSETLIIPVSVTNNPNDFVISDPNGYDIVQFKNGHIKTKNFDSANFKAVELAGKKISILGDSISTFGVPDQNNATGTWTYPGNRCRYPQSNLLTNVNYTWWKRLLDYCGATLGINESWAGSRVSNTQQTDSGDLGPNRCISSLTRIGHLGLNGNPDYIFVYAGTNDAGNGVTIGTFDTTNPKNYTEQQIAELPVATFADAFRTMLIRLLYYYRSSKIIVLFPNFTETYYTITNLDQYIEIEREACDFFGIRYIDLRTAGITVYNGITYLPDGTHPNAAGMELLFNIILNSLS